jgi:hypothetical protein
MVLSSPSHYSRQQAKSEQARITSVSCIQLFVIGTHCVSLQVGSIMFNVTCVTFKVLSFNYLPF